jgi:ribose transport system permease protein
MNQRIFPRVSMDTSTRALLIVLAILIAVGGMVHDQFLSPRYLLLQLQSGALLGIIAAGAMLVILVGHIDLSVPWTLSVSAIVSTAVMQAGAGSTWAELSPLAGLLAGAAIGVLNGFGVAYLRIPSLIWTLAINAILLGASAFYAGNAVVASQPSNLMMVLGSGKLFNLVPNSVLLWVLFSAGLMWLLRRTVIGRYLYLVGAREKAAYLSGIDTRMVVMGAFVLSGLCSAIAGMLLAGYSGQAYQRMGDPYLLPGIAAVVVGGTSILGGRGSYGGTIAGVLVITLISSMLSLMHVPEAIKQICYGILIVGMVCLYSVRQTTAAA